MSLDICTAHSQAARLRTTKLTVSGHRLSGTEDAGSGPDFQGDSAKVLAC